jgi:hypothetical protein
VARSALGALLEVRAPGADLMDRRCACDFALTRDREMEIADECLTAAA